MTAVMDITVFGHCFLHTNMFVEKSEFMDLKGHCIEFKYYADGIHTGLTPPG